MFGFGITYLLDLFKIFPKTNSHFSLTREHWNSFCCISSQPIPFSVQSQKSFSSNYFWFLSHLSSWPFQNVSIKTLFHLAQIQSAHSEFVKRCLMLFHEVNMKQWITNQSNIASKWLWFSWIPSNYKQICFLNVFIEKSNKN